MANFRQYNIQLLPLDTKSTNEVGVDGYKEFFNYLSIETSNAFKNKRMANQSKPLINDTFICPFVVHVEDEFAYGKFVKYHKAETVTDLYSQVPLFEAARGDAAVSNTYYFRFVFDYTWHRFGIEENRDRLPNPTVMMETLEHFLDNIAKKHFPDHVLTLNLISDQLSLKEALNDSNEFGAIDVQITFPNSSRLTEELRQLKDSNAHNIRAHVSPARGARMTEIPKYIRKLVESAPEFGSATITFFKAIHSNTVQEFQKKVYSTSKRPERFKLRQKKSENEFEFVQRSWRFMKALVEKRNETK